MPSKLSIRLKVSQPTFGSHWWCHHRTQLGTSLMRTPLYIFTAQSLLLLRCPRDYGADIVSDWAASDHDAWQAAGP